jgi:hypothetical protein
MWDMGCEQKQQCIISYLRTHISHLLSLCDFCVLCGEHVFSFLLNFLLDGTFTEDEFFLYFHADRLCRAHLGANAATLAIG